MIQEANIGIIEIRTKEVDFHTRVNSTIGTQVPPLPLGPPNRIP